MKHCPGCQIDLPLSSFGKHLNGLKPRCRPCRVAEVTTYIGRNPVEHKARCARYRAANPARRAATVAAWAKKNKDRMCAATARHSAAKLRAVPTWADHDLIAGLYEYARIMREHGVDCHVDHMVPLQGRTVSGLHTHANLTVLTASDNTSKGNRHWPDMP